MSRRRDTFVTVLRTAALMGLAALLILVLLPMAVAAQAAPE
jgi:hypothetical protein